MLLNVNLMRLSASLTRLNISLTRLNINLTLLNSISKKNLIILVSVFIVFSSFFFLTGYSNQSKDFINSENHIKKILVEKGFDISYEVSICDNNQMPVLDFMSARKKSENDLIHVALIKDFKKNQKNGLLPEICFDDKIHKLSETAETKKAAFAINGGYFAIMKEKVYSVGAVMGDFKKYPDFIKHEDYPYFCIFDDGSAGIYKSSELKKFSRQEYAKIKSYIQTKPLLVCNGRASETLKKYRAAVTSKNPRSAIGKLKDGKIICVVVEGRQEDADGMSQVELAEFLESLGVDRAVNLDGGGSATIVLNNTLMNKPSGGNILFSIAGEERSIHSSIIFKTK